jgi:hypothetical protein
MKLMPIIFPCSFAGLPVYVASSQSAPFIFVARRWACDAMRAAADILLSRIGFSPVRETFIVKRLLRKATARQGRNS